MSNMVAPSKYFSLGSFVHIATRHTAEPQEIAEDAWLLELEDLERDTGRLVKKVLKVNRPVKSAKTRFLNGDILYGKLRPYLNKIIEANEDGYCSTEIVPIRPGHGISARYVYYWLHHPQFRSYADAASRGTNMPRLSPGKLRSAPFALALPDRQNKIVAFLDRYFRELDVIRTNLTELITRLPMVWDQATTRLLRLPPGEGQRVSLGDLTVISNYGTARKSAPSGPVPVLRMGNIQHGELDWSDLVYTSDIEDIQKFRLLDGDLLFNRTNSPELVGKTAVFRSTRDAIFAGYLIRVRLSPKVLPEYVALMLNSPEGRTYCRSVKVDGLSQSNINMKNLLRFPLQLPDMEQQQKTVEVLDEVRDRLRTVESEARATLSRLAESRDAALVQAFSSVPRTYEQIDTADHAWIHELESEVLAMANEEAGLARARRSERSNLETRHSLSRSAVSANHLALILQTRDHMSPEELWTESKLSIDDFYEQLRDEIMAGLVAEQREGDQASMRKLVRH